MALSARQVLLIARSLIGEARSLPALIARYPMGILQETISTLETPQQAEADIPIILIHGFFHNRSGFFAMRNHLRRQGFHKLYAFNYSSTLNTIEAMADSLATRVEEVLLISRREKVHIVGHSLGGLVARYYIQALGGDQRVSKCVTMGTPHQGTVAAYLSAAPAARQMRPGSKFIMKLNALPVTNRVRWYSFYSRRDVLVTPYKNALLPEDRFNAINFNMDDQGHLSFLMSPEVIDAVVEYLRDF